MIARLMRACGLDLGRPEDLMGPAPDNPDGFFEHRGIVALNDELLSRANASWDSPPRDFDWMSTTIADLRPLARGIISELGAREPWGWKDPRTSLTLRFWRAEAADLRVVVALRNPLEVATSLQRRNGMAIEDGLVLWRCYNDALLDATEPEGRLVSAYDRYFDDAECEIQRLTAFAGMQPAAGALHGASKAVEASLRHSTFTERDMTEASVPGELMELYRRLKQEASDDMAGVQR